jgi:hypothetical protein
MREQRVVRVLLGVALFVCLAVLLLMFEGSFGHDGLLCEWGIDLDGEGGTTSGCY